MHIELGSFRRILDRVVEHVEDRGAQVFRVAHYGEPLGVWIDGEMNRRLLQVVTLERGANAVADHVFEHQPKPDLVTRSLAHFSRLEHLLHGSQQALAIGEHDVVELLSLGFGQLVALQGLQIEADGGDGRL